MRSSIPPSLPASASGCILALLLAAPAAMGGITYSLEKIGIPTGAGFSRAVALNDFGQMAVTTGSAGYLWTPGAGFTSLGTMTPAARGVYVQDINNAGHIAGYETASDWANRGFVWNGSFTDVGTLDPSPNGGATATRARGINDNGRVVGDSKTFVNYSPFRYDGSIQALSRVGAHAYAHDINSSNVITGTVSKYSGTYVGYAYKWLQDGTAVELGLGGASAINDHGQVSGASGGRACVWDTDGTQRTYGILPYSRQSSSTSHDINNQGQVVGYSRNSGTGIYDRRYATIWSPDGTIHDLSTLTTDLDGWKLVEATGINEHGQICGYGSADQYAGSDQQGFLLTPSNYRSAGSGGTIDLSVVEVGGAQAGFSFITSEGSFFSEYLITNNAALELMYGPLPDWLSEEDLQCWLAEFSGEFSGDASVTVHYDPSMLPGAEGNLSLLHWTGSDWETLRGGINPTDNTISISTDSFSPFVLIPEPATSLLAALAGVFLLRRSRQ